MLAWFGALELSAASVTSIWNDIMEAGDWGQATIAAFAARRFPVSDATVRYLCRHAGWTQLHFLIAHAGRGSSRCDAEAPPLSGLASRPPYVFDSAYYME
eukprot:1502399-Prymnesium_polylepis.1